MKILLQLLCCCFNSHLVQHALCQLHQALGSLCHRFPYRVACLLVSLIMLLLPIFLSPLERVPHFLQLAVKPLPFLDGLPDFFWALCRNKFDKPYVECFVGALADFLKCVNNLVHVYSSSDCRLTIVQFVFDLFKGVAEMVVPELFVFCKSSQVSYSFFVTIEPALQWAFFV